MNSRYAAYCRAHGMTPEEMRATDEHRFTVSMTGYLNWLHSKMNEWRGTVGLREDVELSATDQMDFDAWLDA
jgi:hypothetical protein